MKSTYLILSAIALGFIAQTASAHAQNIPTPNRVIRPGVIVPEATTLGSNYRLNFAAISDEKPIGDISMLTCSSNLEVSGYLSKPTEETFPATSISVRGTLTEAEGGALVFGYAIALQVPYASSTQRAAPDVKAVMTTVSFANHTSSGTLLVKPGRSYNILKVGGVIYSVTITPESDK